jgi:hypothetical protein
VSDKSSQLYSRQHRGDASAYENYFAGMDASMQQKIALTTAHFPTRGVIADMGSGSGRGNPSLLYEQVVASLKTGDFYTMPIEKMLCRLFSLRSR